MIKALNGNVTRLCRIAQTSRSGYYKWLNKRQQDKDKVDYLLIKKIFNQHKEKIGWRPIQMRLKAEYGIIMNHKKIKRIMREKGLVVKIRKQNPYKMIMKKTQNHRTFNNNLNRNFKQSVPGQIFCTDITYLYYSLGRKAYLSAIKDVATREIVSWQLSQDLTMKFVLDSIDKLKNNNTLKNGAVIHSDQGVHYTNPEYSDRVKKINLIQSMSRKGNCVDNAPIESFFGHLKDDVDCKKIKTFIELHDTISEYMDYYNNRRYQWEIKKMTPVEYRDYLLVQGI